MPWPRSAMARISPGPRWSARARRSNTTKSLPRPFILRKGMALVIETLLAATVRNGTKKSEGREGRSAPVLARLPHEEEGKQRNGSKTRARGEGRGRAELDPQHSSQNAREQGEQPRDEAEQT